MIISPRTHHHTILVHGTFLAVFAPGLSMTTTQHTHMFNLTKKVAAIDSNHGFWVCHVQGTQPISMEEIFLCGGWSSPQSIKIMM
jgi:hypothetical protein